MFHFFIASLSRKQSSDFAIHSGHQQRHMPQLLVRIFPLPQNGQGSKTPFRVHSSCARMSPNSARISMSVIVITSVGVIHSDGRYMLKSVLHRFFEIFVIQIPFPVSVIVSRAVCHKK